MRIYKRKDQDGNGQRFPDKMSTLIDVPIVITEVEEGQNKFGNMALITYYKADDEDQVELKAQTNSEVLIKQLQEQVEEGLPVETIVREVKSNKNKRYTFYTLGEPGAK